MGTIILVAGVCMVSNKTSDGMTGVCVMSDGVVCVMCQRCIKSVLP